MPKDYYHILGIDKNASEAEIKKAYRILAKDIHPDVNDAPEASSAFHELNEAYMVLSDQEKRKAYDQDRSYKPPQLTEEQLREILRRQRDTVFNDFRFQSRNVYPPTNYKANEKAATILNVIMMCFALTLILDYFINTPVGSYEVKSVTRKLSLTGSLKDADKYLLVTDRAFLEISYHELQQLEQAPTVAEIRKSLIYGNYSFRLSQGMDFIRNQKYVLVTYFFVAIVFIAGSSGLFPLLSPERKFNAAIVSTFFSLVIIALMLIS